MQPQPNTAARLFRTPAFAAFYSQRLQELRGRLAFLRKQAWDINAAWLVHHDVVALQEQLIRDESDQDTSTWKILESALAVTLEQANTPDDEAFEAILDAFRRIDMESPATDGRRVSVRQSENARIEMPPPAFWRRWTDDAAPPSYPESTTVNEADSAESQHPFGFDNIDIDAVIAGGNLNSSSLEIVQESVAPHVTEILDRPEAPPTDPLDDFFSSSSTDSDDEYDWGLEPATTSTAATAATIEDDAWTLAPESPPTPAEPTAASIPAAVAPASAPAVSRSDLRPAPPPATQPETPRAPLATAALAPDPAGLATPAVAPAPPQPPPVKTPIQPVAPVPPRRPVAPAVAVRAEPLRPKLKSGTGSRIYHLTESDDLACELDQRLEQLEYELELLDNAEELREILGALTPNLVLVDAQFKQELPSIGEVLQIARKRSSDPIKLLVLCQADTMETRLMARRAGADALLFAPDSSDEVIAHIERLLEPPKDDRQRVLIVEDDRSQGLFAESILRNAGMEAEVVEDGLKVMEAMQRFQPDLVLMDLYMPNCSGIELTALIREHDEFLNTPIVFLSGEMDTDKHYEALSVGGDDFLSKPIRPKYLIATVNNRIRRARAVLRHTPVAPQPEPTATASVTGLYFRSAMLERLEQALLETEPAQRTGGVMFIGIKQVAEWRQQLGLTTIEELLEDVAQFLVTHLGASTLASRYGDGCFLIFDPLSSPEQLRLDAQQVRDAIAFTPFETPRGMVSLDVVVGVAELQQPFADATAVLNAAEHDARLPDTPVVTPPAPAVAAADTERLHLIQALLADALEQGQMDLDYQPIIALQSDGQAQYQTLLRLRRDDAQDLTAAELLPVLRAQGRLPEFDRWALSKARDVAASRLAIAKPVTLFVSQSVETLLQPDYVTWLLQSLQGVERIGSALVIEINTEEAYPHLDALLPVCTRLVENGLRFCLNRYGADEVHDSALEALPIDMVKAAPAIIAGLDNNTRRAQFGASVEYLHEKDIAVIAPRVEETRTAAVLWMSGIDYIQGNLVQLASRSLDFDFSSAVL